MYRPAHLPRLLEPRRSRRPGVRSVIRPRVTCPPTVFIRKGRRISTGEEASDASLRDLRDLRGSISFLARAKGPLCPSHPQHSRKSRGFQGLTLPPVCSARMRQRSACRVSLAHDRARQQAPQELPGEAKLLTSEDADAVIAVRDCADALELRWPMSCGRCRSTGRCCFRCEGKRAHGLTCAAAHLAASPMMAEDAHGATPRASMTTSGGRHLA